MRSDDKPGVELPERLFVVADVFFADILHVVHVEPHLVAQTVRHEQRLSADGYCLLHVAPHQAERLEAFGDHERRLVVHPIVVRIGTGQRERAVVGRQHDVVHVLLFLREPAADGKRAREVAAVVHRRLGSRVDEHQTPAEQRALVAVVVQRLAVLADDREERDAGSVLQRDALDRSGDLALDDARTAHFHSHAVHLAADLAGLFDLVDFVGVLDLAQRYDRLGQLDRGVKRNPLGRETEQPGDLQRRFAPVRRQEMDLAPLGDGRFDPLAELRQR